VTDDSLLLLLLLLLLAPGKCDGIIPPSNVLCHYQHMREQGLQVSCQLRYVTSIVVWLSCCHFCNMSCFGVPCGGVC
jgi:hypothetical protein